MRRELERIEIPGEHDARVSAWELVHAAFAEREPAPRRVPVLRPLLAFAAVAAVVAAALSPPGRAVLRTVREAIGIANAEEALFSLPAQGRLVVVGSERGAFVVHRDGSRRRLGDYDEATWSPHGRFIVATHGNALFALTPEGEERWSLRRPDVRFPRWSGTKTDTRIAYVSRRSLRVVAGDGTGDHVLAVRDPFLVAPAWRGGARHVLAFATNEGVFVFDANGNALWGTNNVRASSLAWSADGRRLLAVSPRSLHVFDDRGRLVREMPIRTGTFALGAEFAPTGHVFALRARSVGGATRGRSQLLLVNADRVMRPRQLFIGVGAFGDLAWSPDGRWLLLDWIGADQWLFIRTRGMPKIRAVSNIGAQFGRGPHLLDWCCP